MPPEIEVSAIELPGRGARFREKPFVYIAPLVRELSEALRPYLHEPFSFFGHSMGGLIAFEFARALRRQRLPGPIQLFVSGHRAPHLLDPASPIHRMPDTAVLSEVQRLYGVPEGTLKDSEMVQLLLPVLRADFAVCETYIYSAEEPLPCPIIAFGGLEDCKVSREQLAAWRCHTHGSFTLRMFHGNHYFCRGAQGSILRVLASTLKQGDGSSLIKSTLSAFAKTRTPVLKGEQSRESLHEPEYEKDECCNY